MAGGAHRTRPGARPLSSPLAPLARRLAQRAFFAPARALYYAPFRLRERLRRRAHAVPEPAAQALLARPLEELCASAEAYYRMLPDPAALLARPFDDPATAPAALYRLGLLLAGMRLGRGMSVLDFGAGSCWLSHKLNLMGCTTVSVEPSRSALELGRRLFALHPPAHPLADPPRFLPFDGERIELEPESVDRVVCFDAFHHVPNPEAALRELHRVLRTGGVAGFSEPGRRHARSAQAQAEMRNYGVLERDVEIELVREQARRAGFATLYAKPLVDHAFELSAGELERIVLRQQLPERLVASLLDTMIGDATTFFLVKGEYVADSRTAEGLRAAIAVSPPSLRLAPGAAATFRVHLRNRGAARWRTSGRGDYGVVRLGAHLHEEGGKLVDFDHFRLPLPREVGAGEEVVVEARVPLPGPGRFRLVFDLVSEGLCWFETAGSPTAHAVVEAGA